MGREQPTAPPPNVAQEKVKIRYAPADPPLLALIIGIGLGLLSLPFWFFGGRSLLRNLRLGHGQPGEEPEDFGTSANILPTSRQSSASSPVLQMYPSAPLERTSASSSVSVFAE